MKVSLKFPEKNQLSRENEDGTVTNELQSIRYKLYDEKDANIGEVFIHGGGLNFSVRSIGVTPDQSAEAIVETIKNLFA